MGYPAGCDRKCEVGGRPPEGRGRLAPNCSPTAGSYEGTWAGKRETVGRKTLPGRGYRHRIGLRGNYWTKRRFEESPGKGGQGCSQRRYRFAIGGDWYGKRVGGASPASPEQTTGQQLYQAELCGHSVRAALE